MECNNVNADIGENYHIIGDCSPPPKKPTIDMNHTKNIDDISTPSELKFDEDFDFVAPEITDKRREIEQSLKEADRTALEQWQSFAKSKFGLISDEYRRKIWPLLVGVTIEELTDPPSLDDLSAHSEYNQVVLDVNRSLKRFPPGIPYEQRVALQDQLTVLILRVILRYPHLKYYQGYHDVAITLLLVCGDRASFPLLCRLSEGARAPLAPFMRASMAPTQHLLNYMRPVLRRARPDVAERLERAGVGTMFALPWYLTWFGHSLPRYATVVRLYDYFLAAPPLFPVYVTAAIVLHRATDVLACECDMAMLHCLLSRLPDDLPFEDILVSAEALYAEHDPEDVAHEDILVSAEALYAEHDPEDVAHEVLALERREEAQRLEDEERLRRRRAAAAAAAARRPPPGAALAAALRRYLPPAARRALLATATVLLGVYVYYRPDLFNR